MSTSRSISSSALRHRSPGQLGAVVRAQTLRFAAFDAVFADSVVQRARADPQLAGDLSNRATSLTDDPHSTRFELRGPYGERPSKI